MTKPAVGPAFLAIFLMAIPAHAEVYKWVDENGLAHYTDQPPSKGGHTRLHMDAAPVQAVPSMPQNGSAESQMQKAQRFRDMDNAAIEKQRAADKALREKLDADYESVKRSGEQLQKDTDDALTAECKRNREIYCDKGVEGIRREEAKRGADQEADREEARRNARNPVVPRYTGNDIHIK
jgi:hypothetical protein